jgi:hypothetical protein
MKVLGHIPANARSLNLLILDCAHLNTYLSLLKTWHQTRFFFNNFILSRLGGKEYELNILPRHRKTKNVECDRYEAAKAINLMAALPGEIGQEVETAQYAGMGNRFRLVLLKGAGLELLVEARSFSTVYDRHPEARWWFAAGEKHWLKPVVLLDNQGFVKNVVVGAIIPISFKDVEKAVTVTELEATAKLKQNGGLYVYETIAG